MIGKTNAATIIGSGGSTAVLREYTSSATWTIKRIESLTSGDVVTSATGSWDNRLSLIYS